MLNFTRISLNSSLKSFSPMLMVCSLCIPAFLRFTGMKLGIGVIGVAGFLCYGSLLTLCNISRDVKAKNYAETVWYAYTKGINIEKWHKEIREPVFCLPRVYDAMLVVNGLLSCIFLSLLLNSVFERLIASSKYFSILNILGIVFSNSYFLYGSLFVLSLILVALGKNNASYFECFAYFSLILSLLSVMVKAHTIITMNSPMSSQFVRSGCPAYPSLLFFNLLVFLFSSNINIINFVSKFEHSASSKIFITVAGLFVTGLVSLFAFFSFQSFGKFIPDVIFDAFPKNDMLITLSTVVILLSLVGMIPLIMASTVESALNVISNDYMKRVMISSVDDEESLIIGRSNTGTDEKLFPMSTLPKKIFLLILLYILALSGAIFFRGHILEVLAISGGIPGSFFIFILPAVISTKLTNRSLSIVLWNCLLCLIGLVSTFTSFWIMKKLLVST